MSPDPPVSSSDSADERNPTIPLASEDATQASPSGRHPDSVPRGSIAGYELVRELHRGGQGVVYQAIQDATKRKVAIKVLLEGPYASPAAKRRFEREIELAASLKHANIISVFHSGQTDEGRQFCAMEYVRGVPICEYVRHKTLTLEETLGLFQDVCDAVNYAHQKGVIHRDLKPSNILVDTEGAPKLLDFGLSKMVGGAEQTLISMTGQVMGTLPYMSPEQTRGNPDEIDIRTDVYALGVILYQMLTGEYPYPVVGQMSEVLKHIAETPPTPPSRVWRAEGGVAKRSVRRLRPGECPIDDELETVVLKALSKERERRYQSAGDLSRDLGHYLSGEPIEARRDSSWYLLKKTLSLHRRAVGVAVGLVAVIVAALIVSTVFWRQAVDERNHAQQAADDAQQAQAAEATQRAEAERLAELSRRRMVQLLQAEGTRLMMAGDLIGSLHPFVEALRLDQGDPEREEMHRIRLGTILRQCPKLAAIHVFDDPPFFTDGEHIVTRNDESVRVWDALDGRPLSPPIQHAQVVHVSFSPDGHLLATSGKDNTARVWVVATGALRGAPLAHSATVARTMFSPDGTRVVTASEDSTARVWDVATGSAITPPLTHDGEVRHAEFSPDGRVIATGSSDNTARLWNAATGEPIGALMQCEHSVHGAVFSPDGQFLATADANGHLRIWDSATGEPLCSPFDAYSSQWGGHVGPEPRFSPDGERVAMRRTGPITLLSVPDGSPCNWTITHNARHDPVNCLSFSTDGRLVATAGVDRTVRIWDAHTGMLRMPVLGDAAFVSQVAFHPNGHHVVTLSRGGARVWDLITQHAGASPPGSKWHWWARVFGPDGKWKDVPVLQSEPGRDQAVAIVGPASPTYGDFFPDAYLRRFSNRVVTRGPGTDVTVRDALTHEPITPPLTHAADVRYARFSPDGAYLVTVTTGAVRVWDATTGLPVTSRLRPRERVQEAHFSPDGRLLLTIGRETAQLWKTTTGAVAAPPFKPDGEIKLAWYGDQGARIVSVAGPVVQVSDVIERIPLHPALTMSGSVSQCALSPDAARIFVVSDNGDARLIDAGTGNPLAQPIYHGLGVRLVEFSPLGTCVATSDYDHTLRIWDVATGALVARPIRHDSYLVGVAFSADGRRILVTADDADYLYDVSTGELLIPPCANQQPSTCVPVLSKDVRWLIRIDDYRRLTCVFDLTALDWPLDDLVLMTQVLSSHERREFGDLRPLPADRTINAWNVLRSKYPDFFTATPQQITAWRVAAESEVYAQHERAASDCFYAQDWVGTLRHLNAVIDMELTSAQHYCRRAHALCETGDWQSAKRDFYKALELTNGERLPWGHDRWLARIEASDDETFQRAKDLVAKLFRELPLRVDVIAELRSATDLDEHMRAAALRLAIGSEDRAETLNEHAWEIVRSPERTAQEYKLALRKAEAMIEREPYNGYYLNTLGVAQYRVGDYAAALETLHWADEVNSVAQEGGIPADVAFIAMALHRLGKQAEALDALERLRALVQAPGDADNEESRGFLHEAESLIMRPGSQQGLSP